MNSEDMYSFLGEATLNVKYFFLKLFLAMFPAGFFVITQGQQKIVYILFWIIVIDTILGTMVATKYKIFTSRRMCRLAYKVSLYFFALLTTYLVACISLSFESMFFYVGSYIIITEAISNFEKLALLGFSLPTQILAKLNKDFWDLKYDEDKKEEALKRILEKKIETRNK